MTAEELLRVLYGLEKPALQTNDWANLKVRVQDLVAATCPPANAGDVMNLLRSLRLAGQIMFLPDWQRWGVEEDDSDGALIPSVMQWEPLGTTPPTWRRRPTFIPEELKHWLVRSRVAECTRLVSSNRERFGLEASTAHLGYELQERFRPDRNAVTMSSVILRLQQLADNGAFQRATNTLDLKLAVEVVGHGLGHSHIAAFQERAWEAILRSLFSNPRCIDASMITAGVSSGKTFSFLLPALTLLVYRALRGQGGRNRALVIYPRTSLVEDQFHGLCELLARINAQLALRRPGTTVRDHPALDAGQMLAQSLGVETTSLADTLPLVRQQGIEVILTTPESLKNRMLDPRAVDYYLKDVEVVILDEIHLMEGLAGCHGIYFIRRLRQLLRDLRDEPTFEPAWVGASATVAEPVDHCARVLSLDPTRVSHISPAATELVRFGTFHHVFLHTRVGKPSISAVTNGVSCLVHTRNDGSAFNHYVDPSAAALAVRPSPEIPKTLTFVDSLSTIGRLRFTTADNEKTYDPHEAAPPYYSWFFRPAARFEATATETRSIGEDTLRGVRKWCEKCYHGVPSRIDSSALRHPEFRYLRTGLRMTEKAKARSTPPGFAQALANLQGSVGNLDQCPFHEFRLCWWFSQDSGARRTVGTVQVPIDQNRALAYTSKTDEEEAGLHQDVNDYFLTRARTLWEFGSVQARRAAAIPDRDEAVSTLLASPRIEVGVDFRNVRDGATHKAMRSAASFQQKVGRVGREDGSDSLVLSFLAHRPTDAHFAHYPARLIDAGHLDPIPLKSENPDVLRSHMFAAGLEFIGSRPAGTIPNGGKELNIIGTGSQRVPDPWEGKVRGCIQFITSQRPSVTNFILAATNQTSKAAAIASEAIDSLLGLLGDFVTDLSGAYTAGQTPAHWFKENTPAFPAPAFAHLLQSLTTLLEALRNSAIVAPPQLLPHVNALNSGASAAAPSASQLSSTAAALHGGMVQMGAGLQANVAMTLFGAVAHAQTVATALAAVPLAAPLAQVRRAHKMMQAFFEQPDPGTRTREQYYLHDILTKLLPFRDYYPFGLVRTHFQHVNARQVLVHLPDDKQDSESLSTALYELLPGTWNYRWVRPRKSLCGAIDRVAGSGEHFANLSNIEGLNRAAFEPTGATLSPGEEPADMPAIPTGTTVPILRPIRLWVDRAFNRPDARYDNQLIGDDDEAGRIDDPDQKRSCPTLPRAFPATWYRITQGASETRVIGRADPENPSNDLPHCFPAIGRSLFKEIAYSTQLKTDKYVYAIDRSYGSGAIESPRIHYRYGNPALSVVLGDTLKSTDGLTFRLNQSLLNELVSTTFAASSPIRGEVTIRAVRRFISRSSGCGPFQAEMLRKVLLMDHLDSGGTLASLDSTAIRTALARIDRLRFDQISSQLIDGTYAGVDPAEATTGRGRQSGWYADAWPVLQTVQALASTFTDQFVQTVGKDLLVHTLSVVTLDAASRLVGAADGDLAYFHRADVSEFYVFDSVEGGNGYSETTERFFHIPPLRRILAAKGGTSGSLPNADGFMLLEEGLAACPAHSATRLLVETCHKGVANAAQLRYPKGLVADLQARIRHEYDPVAGARNILAELFQSQPSVFQSWHDVMWLQVLPERFAAQLVSANICVNLDSLRIRTHLCVTGCLECVDNADQSVYGALASREYVSKNLLDALRQRVLAKESQAFLKIPPGTTVATALQANAARPILDGTGTPVTAVIDENGKKRQILLTQMLSTVSPDFSVVGGPLLTASGGSWDVHIPFIAAYRDERPMP